MFASEILELMALENAKSSISTQRGSIAGRKDLRYGRDYASGHNQLIRDYFSKNPVYGAAEFRRRFRMSKTVFNRVLDKLTETNVFLPTEGTQ